LNVDGEALGGRQRPGASVDVDWSVKTSFNGIISFGNVFGAWREPAGANSVLRLG